MTTSMLTDVPVEEEVDLDAIAEMRLRTWARSNYCGTEDRDESWHPIILDEMSARDREQERKRK